jgi:hypothetical protein
MKPIGPLPEGGRPASHGLAYPGESEQDYQRRCGAFMSLCAWVLRVRAEIDPDWATRSQLVKPVYTLQTESDCNRGFRTLPLRLHERMVAARMAYPFLMEAQTGEVSKLPGGLKRLSINAMSELVLEDAGYSDPENVETRIWRPSRPVIHLASAVQNYLRFIEIEAAGLYWLLTCRAVVENVIRNAEYCEALVGRSKRLHVDPDILVRIRLTS